MISIISRFSVQIGKCRQAIPNNQIVQLAKSFSDQNKNDPTDTKAIAKDILQSDITRSSSLIDHEHKMVDKAIEVAKEIVKAFPEEPTTCCMSGCTNCVWLDYAEQISDYYKDGGERAKLEIMQKVTDENIKAFLMHEMRMRKKQS